MLDIMNRKEQAVYLTKSTGVLPAIKLKLEADIVSYIQAMYDGGARVVEITMTTPKALQHFEALSAQFAGRLCLAAGTVLGVIYNLYGDIVGEVKAPQAGVIFGLRSRASVLEGQWCCFFGVVEKTVDNLIP